MGPSTLSGVDTSDRDRLERLARRTAREIVAVAVGFTVLGVNRAQVERRRMKAARRENGNDRPDRS